MNIKKSFDSASLPKILKLTVGFLLTLFIIIILFRSCDSSEKDKEDNVFEPQKMTKIIPTSKFSKGTEIILDNPRMTYIIRDHKDISIDYAFEIDGGKELNIYYDGILFTSLEKNRRVKRPREIRIVPIVPVKITIR